MTLSLCQMYFQVACNEVLCLAFLPRCCHCGSTEGQIKHTFSQGPRLDCQAEREGTRGDEDMWCPNWGLASPSSIYMSKCLLHHKIGSIQHVVKGKAGLHVFSLAELG